MLSGGLGGCQEGRPARPWGRDPVLTSLCLCSLAQPSLPLSPIPVPPPPSTFKYCMESRFQSPHPLLRTRCVLDMGTEAVQPLDLIQKPVARTEPPCSD